MANYKRRIYLINAKFQLKYAFLVCIFVIVATFIYPWTIYDIFKSIRQYVQPEIDVEAQRNQLLIFLGLMQLSLMAIIGVFMIFITHKVAGPMHKLMLTFKAIKDGGPLRRVYFRKGDNFQEVAHGFNELVEVLQSRYDGSSQELTEVLESLRSIKQDIPELKDIILKLDLITCEKISDEEKVREKEKKSE